MLSSNSQLEIWIVGHPFEIASFVLAVLAIVFACIQFKDSKHQDKKMERVACTIEDVAKSMSTQYVGLFPKNMDSITTVVARADKTLDLMTDFVGYGHYSAPGAFEKYFSAIKSARDNGVAVRMLVYSQEAADQGSQYSQFKENNFKDVEMVGDRFRYFFYEAFPGLQVPGTWNEFNAVIDGMQIDFQRELLRKGVTIRTVSEEMLMFAWIEDDQEAVFAFLNSGEGYRELSFRTQDSKLITVFRDRFDAMWKQGQAIDQSPAAVGWMRPLPPVPDLARTLSAGDGAADLT
jgi:hypothetical protein